MGFWKKRAFEQQSRGNSPPSDRFVRPVCVADVHLAKALTMDLQESACSYCDAPRAADISVLLDELSDVIQAGYTEPANELPYESREGGYQGQVYVGSELVLGLDEWTDNEELLEDAADAFAESDWCEHDYFALKPY